MSAQDTNLALEDAAMKADSMKEAFKAVGLDVLTLAKKHKDIIKGTNASAASKSLDMVHKIRGDYAKGELDERPVIINIPWGYEPPNAAKNKTNVESEQINNELEQI